MPKGQQESKKTQQKKKEKVVEDLTFGLKNKNKSAQVQKYCKEVTNKVMFANVKVTFNTYHILSCRAVPRQSKNTSAKIKKKKKRRRTTKLFCRTYSSK